MTCKQIIEIATVLARHGAGVQEDKVNQNKYPIQYSSDNLSKFFCRMEGLFYIWQQKTGNVIQKLVEFLITNYSLDVNKHDKVCDSEKYFVFSVHVVMFWIN